MEDFLDEKYVCESSSAEEIRLYIPVGFYSILSKLFMLRKITKDEKTVSCGGI